MISGSGDSHATQRHGAGYVMKAKMRRVLVLALSFSFVAALSLYLAVTDQIALPDADQGNASELHVLPSPSATIVPQESGETASSNRSLPTLVPLVGVVLGDDGMPIANAELSWVALQPDFSALGSQTHADHGALLLDRTVNARSSTDGAFQFDRIPEGATSHSSVVWITAPGYIATPVLLQRGKADVTAATIDSATSAATKTAKAERSGAGQSSDARATAGQADDTRATARQAGDARATARQVGDEQSEGERSTATRADDERATAARRDDGGAPAGQSSDGPPTAGPSNEKPSAHAPVNDPDGLPLWTWPADLRVKRTPALEITVVDAQQRPITGAQVLQFLSPGRVAPEEQRKPERVARKLFVRKAQTNEDGKARMSYADGVFFTYARKGEQLSATAFQERPAPVQLVLVDTFTVEGRVRVPRAGLCDEGAYLSIFGCPKVGNVEGMTSIIGRVSFTEDGGFGPLVCPIPLNTAGLRVRTGNGPLLESYVDRPMPGAGEHIYVTLDAVLGESCEVEVVDRQGAPVVKAGVGTWINPSWDSWVSGAYAQTDEQGRTRISVPAGRGFTLSAAAEGFAQKSTPTLIWSESLSPIRLELVPAGAVELTVTHQGKPVPNFSVAVWTSDPRKGWVQDFASADGRGVVTDLAPARYSFQATSGQLPQSETLSLEVESGVTAQAVIEIPEAVPVSAQVIDAETGAALPQARVVLHNSLGSSLMWSRDVVLPVDSRGAFSVPQIGKAGGAVLVSADGYAAAAEVFQWTAEGAPPPSVIPLQKRNRLEVWVQHQRGDALKGYFLSSSLGFSLAATAVPADGRFVLEQQSPTSGVLTLHLPDGSSMTRSTSVAPQGWNRLRFEVGFTGILEVQAQDARTERALSGGELILRDKQRAGDVARALRIGQRWPLNLQELAPGEYLVEARSADDRIVATRAVEVLATGGTTCALTMQEPPLAVRVVDAQRQPLSNARIELVGAQSGAAWFVRGFTDADGVFMAGGIVPGKARLALDHDAVGLVRGLECDLRELLEPTEIRVLPGEAAEVLVTDAGQPRPGIVLIVEHPEHSILARSKFTTGVDGIARITPSNPSRLRVFVRSTGYWSTEHALTIPSASRLVIPLRALSSVRLVALGPYGKPLAGIRWELYSEEFQASVAEWIAAGRIQHEGGLATGALGECLVEGLPAGDYRYRAILPAGAVVEGQVSLPPRGQATVEARAQ